MSNPNIVPSSSSAEDLRREYASVRGPVMPVLDHEPVIPAIQEKLDTVSQVNTESMQILSYLITALFGEAGVESQDNSKPVDSAQMASIIKRLDLRVSEANCINKNLMILRDRLLGG